MKSAMFRRAVDNNIDAEQYSNTVLFGKWLSSFLITPYLFTVKLLLPRSNTLTKLEHLSAYSR